MKNLTLSLHNPLRDFTENKNKFQSRITIKLVLTLLMGVAYLLLSLLTLTGDNNMSKNYSFIELYQRSKNIQNTPLASPVPNNLPEQTDRPKRCRSDKKQFILVRDTFFADAGTIFHEAGRKYYQSTARNGQIMRFQRTWVENNQEWFKVYEETKYNSSDVLWILQRYLDGDKPHVSFAELIDTYKERKQREFDGKIYNT